MAKAAKVNADVEEIDLEELEEVISGELEEYRIRQKIHYEK